MPVFLLWGVCGAFYGLSVEVLSTPMLVYGLIQGAACFWPAVANFELQLARGIRGCQERLEPKVLTSSAGPKGRGGLKQTNVPISGCWTAACSISAFTGGRGPVVVARWWWPGGQGPVVVARWSRPGGQGGVPTPVTLASVRCRYVSARFCSGLSLTRLRVARRCFSGVSSAWLSSVWLQGRQAAAYPCGRGAAWDLFRR